SRNRLSRRIRDVGSSLRGTEDEAVLQDALMLAKAFIAEGEECMAAPHWAADHAAEVVALERGLVAGVARQRKAGCRSKVTVEVVASIQRFVAEVVERLTVELVGAGARGHGHNRSIAAAVFRAEALVVDLK